MIKKIKETVIELLIMSGIMVWLNFLWAKLEETFDGGVQESVADTVIAIILVLIIWNQIKKWFVIKESEVDQ